MKRILLLSLIAVTALADAGPGWLGFSFLLRRNAAEQWLEVRIVAPGGPADKAGLKVGDAIFEINGKPLKVRDDLAMLELLATVKPRQPLTLTVARADQRLRMRIVADEMSDERYERWQLNLEVAKRKRAEAR
ncbi:MAG TPA: PDZ domain-containing protein [Thermoanaerobaculia bacterium]|nr:PDZ domain-containing protein [Thermoanaerobaculia bacterium]